MKARQAFVTLVAMLASTLSEANDVTADKMAVYKCANKMEAMACRKCTKLRESALFNQVQFQINVARSSVVTHRFLDSQLYVSRSEENCKVISKKNWACGKEGGIDPAGNYLEDRMGMKNGVYYSAYVSRIKGLPRFDVQAADYKIFMCARALSTD